MARRQIQTGDEAADWGTALRPGGGQPVLKELRVAVIGAGHLAEALVRGWRQSGMPGAHIRVTNRSRFERLDRLAEQYGTEPCKTKAQALPGAEVVVLAVRPGDVEEALLELRPVWPEGAVLVSPVAGVSVRRLRDGLGPALGERVLIARAMPNTSCAVGESATGLFGPDLPRTARERVEALLRCVGSVTHMESERDMDTVTALAGSGPAYVYLMVEGLVQGAVSEGMAPETALDLAVQMVYGAASHLRDSAEDPGELRERVTSPGGTTQAALETLEEHGFRPALKAAVARAAARSRELGRVIGD